MKHDASLALIKFLSDLAKQLGVSRSVYVVGGAVRNFVMDPTGKKYPVKDIDVVIDSVALKGKDSEWFAQQVARHIPVATRVTPNQYGVALLHIVGDWMLGGANLKGEDIEIANARKESYADGGYKPGEVEPATIYEDVVRREFTFNTLLWRLHDLAEGPDKAEILDLTGCGLRDLQEGVMQCPTSPDKTFTDDPSRMIRAIKFLIKYGFTLSLEVKRSIEKNKDKIKNIPHAHLSNMLINTFLREPTGKKALIEMQKLGLLDVIQEIARTQKPFREALANWADKEARVEFLFDLMDFGLPSGKRLGFLSPTQQQQVREHTVNMTAAEADQYLQVLAQPGKVLDTRALMLEFNLAGAAVQQIQGVARAVLISDPDLFKNPALLMARVRMALPSGVRVGKTFTINEGDPVLYGKFLNKPGVVQGFGVNEKGDPTITIEPPSGGQGKEIKLFKVRYDENRAPAKEAVERLARRYAALSECRYTDGGVEHFRCPVSWEVRATALQHRLGVVAGHTVWLVSGDILRDEVDIDFTNGGNPAVYGYVPEGEVWIENFSGPRRTKDIACTLLHEVVEMTLMQQGLVYHDAHEHASAVENLCRDQDWQVSEEEVPLLVSLLYQQWQVGELRPPRRKLANPALPGDYHKTLTEFRGEVARAKQLGLTNSSTLWLAWYMFYREGKVWAAYVIDHLALPAKAAKSVEMAVRLFSKNYPRGKGPSDLVAWFEANEVRFDLLDQARSWPERSEDSGIFKVGPFTVHNTIQATGKALADAEDIINKAVRAAASSGIPGFGQMAYGQLYLVGQLARKNWAAWYMPAKDTIYLRPGVKGSSNEESARHLIHELGHRYWAKKLDRGVKGEWVAHHTLMTVRQPERRLPEVGEVLATIVNSKRVKVDSYQKEGWPGKAVLVEVTTGAPVGSVPITTLMGWVQEADHRGQFPTLYAAKDAEEHFCEALSLYAQGKLAGENLAAFEKIVLGVAPKSVARIAARYKNKKTVKTEDGDEAVVYEYSERQVQNRNREKAERVEKLRGNLHKLQSQVKKDLKSDDPHTRLCALAVGLMNDTYERVGNDESAKDGHVGVTGWMPEHIKFGEGKATITYVGKSGVEQKKVTKDADLIRVMKEAVKDKQKGDTIFTYEDGRVDATAVNEYLDRLDLGITAKDIRGLHANREMQERLKAVRSQGGKLPEDKKEQEKKLKEEFKEALEGAAEAVGHEPATLKSQYLVPGLEDAYLKDGTVLDKLHEKKGGLSVQEDRIARRVAARYMASRHVEAGFTDWLKWLVRPFQVIIKHHKEFISGPVDDAVDAIIKDLAPKLVKTLLEHDVDDAVDQFQTGAQQGWVDATGGRPAAINRVPQDSQGGYAWGFSHVDEWDGKELPDGIRRQIVVTELQQFRKRITEEVVVNLLNKVWHAINPVNTVKAILVAAKKHGWKLGVGFALFELFEHFLLPTLLAALTGNKNMLALASLPIGEVVYAIVFRVLGRTPKELDKAEEEGHLDWYEAQYGPVRLGAFLWATKTDAQREDKDIRQMLKPDPKKKPPREDLRRNRMRTEDADLAGEGDDDLSLNFKKVALDLLAERWLRQFVAANPDHAPGKHWKSEDGKWVGKNKSEAVHTFDDEEAAKAFAQGKSEEDEPRADSGSGESEEYNREAVAEKASKLKDFSSLREYTDKELAAETDEYFENEYTQALAPGAFKDPADLIEKIKKAKPRVLTNEEYGLLGERWDTEAVAILMADNPLEEARQRAKANDRDFSRVEKGFAEGQALPPPIVIKDKTGKLYLMAGNTRMMGAAATGYRLPVKVLELDTEFDAKSAAKLMEGDEDPDKPEGGDKPEENKPEKGKAKATGAQRKQMAQVEEELKALLDKLPKKSAEALKAKLGVKEPSEESAAAPEAREKFLLEVVTALKDAEAAETEVLIGKPVTKEMMERASADPFKGVKWDDTAAVARALARRKVQDEVLLNPAKLGGKELSAEPLEPKDLTARAVEALEQYRHGKASVRKKAAQTAADELASLDPDSPQAEELNRIIDGIHAAMEANGEEWDIAGPDGKPLRSPLDPKQGLLFKQMLHRGKAHLLLGDSSDFKAVREGIRDAMRHLDDAQLQEMAKDTAMAPLANLLGPLSTLAPDVQELLRGLVRDDAMNNMTVNQGLINAVAGKKMPASTPSEVGEDVASEHERNQKSFIECLLKATQAGKDGSDCLEQGKTVRAGNAVAHAKRSLAILQDMEKNGEAVDWSNPRIAAVRHAAETGDAEVLDATLRREKPVAERQKDWIKNIKDPVERERWEKMSPEEFEAAEAAVLGGDL